MAEVLDSLMGCDARCGNSKQSFGSRGPRHFQEPMVMTPKTQWDFGRKLVASSAFLLQGHLFRMSYRERPKKIIRSAETWKRRKTFNGAELAGLAFVY
jgi:hypothetical protein